MMLYISKILSFLKCWKGRVSEILMVNVDDVETKFRLFFVERWGHNMGLQIFGKQNGNQHPGISISL